MRIEISTSGGFVYAPGLQRPMAIDTESLGPQDRERLEGLVESARFFELPAQVGVPGKGAADYQYQVLTVQDGSRRHTVRLLRPIEAGPVRDLVEQVQRQLEVERARQR